MQGCVTMATLFTSCISNNDWTWPNDMCSLHHLTACNQHDNVLTDCFLSPHFKRSVFPLKKSETSEKYRAIYLKGDRWKKPRIDFIVHPRWIKTKAIEENHWNVKIRRQHQPPLFENLPTGFVACWSFSVIRNKVSQRWFGYHWSVVRLGMYRKNMGSDSC